MDIDTTPPTTHCEGKPTMQLDIPTSDQVMMEVDPEFVLASAPISHPLEPKHLSSPSSTSTFNAHSTSPSHSSPSSKPLDSTSQPLRPIPSPPVVLITSSDLAAWPKFKLDQLFVEWLSRPESKSWLNNLLEEARSGKVSASVLLDHDVRPKADRSQSPGTLSPGTRSPGTRSPNSSQITLALAPQQAPSSPVSRLFNKHIPFGDADSSPRSPTHAPTASPYRQTPVPVMVGHLDLGKSGSLSPLLSDQVVTTEDRTAPSRASRQSTLPSPADAILSKAQVAASSQLDIKSGSLQTIRPESQQVSDSKALDKVADGIAGMSAVLEQRRTPSEDIAEMSIEMKTPVPPVTVDQQMASETQATSKAALVVESVSGSRSEGPLQREDDGRLSRQPGKSDVSRETVGTDVSSELGKLAESRKGASPVRDEARETISAKAAAMASVPAQEPRSSDSIIPDAVPQLTESVSPKLVSPAVPPTGPKPSTPEDATMMDTSPRPAKRKTLPRFYFPCGRGAEAREKKERETTKEFFHNLRSQKQVPGVNRTDIAELVVEVIGLPSYFASIVFNAIQEIFGGSQPKGNGNQRQSSATKSDLKSEESEVTMRDVSDKAEHSTVQINAKDSVKAGDASQNSEQATKSDTTMGDVHISDGQDKHLNGFRAGSPGQQHSSSEVVRDPSLVADGSTPLSSGNSREYVTEEQFTAYYNTMCRGYSKEARLFNALLEPGATRHYLIPNDFKPLLRALLMCHQGLAFLQATPEFQQRYSETVIERIYFGCTRQHNGRLTLQDVKRSKLLDTLMVVDEEEDINRERKFFSYEHFYVLYCRFWELDANHDLQIDREDLMRYGSHSLTYRIVDRIFGGYARPLDTPENPGYMSYTDFIWFCLSEEDKTSDTAIDYWFRCIDMDGDGLITMYDMEFFYKEQLHRMECFGHEPVQIRDILCQLLDMINPNVQPPLIRRRDLKHCRLAGNFFNVLFNLNKFFAIEARDPLQIRQEHATPELTDWDRFAALEYLRLSAEEEGEEDESWEDVGDSSNPLMAGEAPF